MIQAVNLTRNKWRWIDKPMRSGVMQPWLIDIGSLTVRLKARYADFAVHPVLHINAKAFADEYALLGLKSNQHALIRDVLLMGHNQPVVFAHSVLPHASLRGAWRGLGKLGNKPLGAALFADQKVKRTPLKYKKLSRNHTLYQRATQHLANKPSYLWARRSVFSLNCATILVTEVFLPPLLSK